MTPIPEPTDRYQVAREDARARWWSALQGDPAMHAFLRDEAVRRAGEPALARWQALLAEPDGDRLEPYRLEEDHARFGAWFVALAFSVGARRVMVEAPDLFGQGGRRVFLIGHRSYRIWRTADRRPRAVPSADARLAFPPLVGPFDEPDWEEEVPAAIRIGEDGIEIGFDAPQLTRFDAQNPFRVGAGNLESPVERAADGLPPNSSGEPYRWIARFKGPERQVRLAGACQMGELAAVRWTRGGEGELLLRLRPAPEGGAWRELSTLRFETPSPMDRHVDWPDAAPETALPELSADDRWKFTRWHPCPPAWREEMMNRL